MWAVFVYILTGIAYAGPNDKWAYVGSANQFDAIALTLAIGSFVAAYLIYRDWKGNGKR